MPSPLTFSDLLRAHRKRMGWTQEEAAVQWNYSADTVSAWERGKRTPRGQEIPRLARLLGVTPDELADSLAAEQAQATARLKALLPRQDQDASAAPGVWGEVRGVYRNRTEFTRDVSYLRLFERAQSILAVGISLNAIGLSYSRDTLIDSIVRDGATYHLCFLDPDGAHCTAREREEGLAPKTLADLTRLNLQHLQAVQRQLQQLATGHAVQLQLMTYDLPPRMNTYIVDDQVMTLQWYAYGRGEDTPLWVLERRGPDGLFEYHVAAARHVMRLARPANAPTPATSPRQGDADAPHPTEPPSEG